MDFPSTGSTKIKEAMCQEFDAILASTPADSDKTNMESILSDFENRQTHSGPWPQPVSIRMVLAPAGDSIRVHAEIIRIGNDRIGDVTYGKVITGCAERFAEE